MKILLSSIGTRGDMEPFLAIAEILHQRGHEVTCLFPEQFRELAEDANLAFETLGPEFIDMLEGKAGKMIMGGSGTFWQKIWAYYSLVKQQQSVNKQMILKQRDVVQQLNPDRIVHSGKVIYPVIWSISNTKRTTLISPVPYLHYVKEHAHVAFHANWGPIINKLTYKLANFGLVRTIMSSVKWLEDKQRISQKTLQKTMFANKAIYTISPALFERPKYWPQNLQVLGYHERNKTSNWQPTTELETFISRHPKLLFVTFGSMINPKPKKHTQTILRVLEKNRIPTIINTAAGGIVRPEKYNSDLIHFVSQIPYDWVFKKVYAVVHHGGSGTTHTALKYGCASMIIPHIIDQFVWNDIVHKKGAGPLGMKLSKMTEKNLEPKILDLFSQPAYKTQAENIGKQMLNENLADELCKAILTV